MGTRAVTEARAALAGQLRASGRAGPAVSAAFLAVPRHVFLPRVEAERAYEDTAIVTKSDARGLPVSSSSQPAMMAIMLEQLGLAAGQRVLEIGAGTGYNAALMATIVGAAGSVVTIDIEPDVAEQARASLAAAGFADVTVACGDGADGVPGHAPYDRIMVTAGAWDLAPRWREQLGDGGRIVLPLSVRGVQLSVAFERAGEHWASRSACRCGFIRLTGAAAGPESVVPLEPVTGLYALVADGPAPDAVALYAALSGPAVPVPAGLTADGVAELASLDLWLTLTEPGLARINLLGNHQEQPARARPRVAVLPFGGFVRGGDHVPFAVAAVSVPDDTERLAAPGVTITGYGPGGAELAGYLAERAAVWDRRGRPGAETLAVRAYPRPARPDSTEGGLIIERPHDVLVAGWPAGER